LTATEINDLQPPCWQGSWRTVKGNYTLLHHTSVLQMTTSQGNAQLTLSSLHC